MKKKSPRLKPCVFCGARQKYGMVGVAGFTDHSARFVVCLKCSVYGPKASNQEEAIKLWNTRSKVGK